MDREQVSIVIEVFWLFGFLLSVLGLIFQILIYILVPDSRKLDYKLLTQLTIARILNIAFEYLVLNVEMKNPAIRDPVFALYLQTDAALICWMFVFTKNLYDKVINVFTQKSSFTLVSVSIWIVTFPIGLLCPLLLSMQVKDPEAKIFYYRTFYRIYGAVKFLILTVNLFLFFKIFKVAFTRTERNVGLLRTCVVSTILVSISSVQVFLTDLLSYFLDDQPNVSVVFGVINSYQVIAITTIFVILVGSVCNESISKTLAKKFIKETI